jgi:thiol:disulfide interchange protein DsbD
MNPRIFYLAVWFVVMTCFATAAQTPDLNSRSPFGIAVTEMNGETGAKILRVDFTVPAQCVLYFERLHFRTADGVEIQPLKMPEPLLETDKVTGKPRKVYVSDFSVEVNSTDLPDRRLMVKFQGCTNDACFFPEQRLFAPDTAGHLAEKMPDASGPGLTVGNTGSAIDWSQAFRGFTVKSQQTGYLTAPGFIAFLDRAATGKGTANPMEEYEKMGTLATLLLIIAGGFLLNFTPCVLPMIPINLAIIGAGSRASSRADGFRKGAVYGLGMALAYGTLGLLVVLTGSKFGTLNSSPWFNIGIAMVFVVMALGMFDVVNIDFSRFSNAGQAGAAVHGSLAQSAVVFAMGVMSALLAGACVAPVIITVVLLSANLYAKGAVAGLALPFLLGAGMALPWPFAGAGLTFLPKPGRWMKQIKQGFGIMILVFALYYGHLAWTASQTAGGPGARSNASAMAVPSVSDEADQVLLDALRQARASGQPLFVDFHASWCKDCSAMDQTVFNRSEVKDHLRRFIAVRYAAEQPNTAPAKPLLDRFNIVGLPTYLVLSTK